MTELGLLEMPITGGAIGRAQAQHPVKSSEAGAGGDFAAKNVR